MNLVSAQLAAQRLANQSAQFTSQGAKLAQESALWAGRTISTLSSQTATKLYATGVIGARVAANSANYAQAQTIWLVNSLYRLTVQSATYVKSTAVAGMKYAQPYVTSAIATTGAFLKANARDIRLIAITAVATFFITQAANAVKEEHFS